MALTPLQVLALAAAGLAAGIINSVIGSGSLLTFPTLLAMGYAPVVANVTNTVGLTFGNISGTIGYRRELEGQRGRVLRLGIPALAGGITGSILLLALPESVFHRVVPVLVLIGVVLVIAQPRLSKWLARGGDRKGHALLLGTGVFLTAVYGGYFGAAQGVILIAILALLINDGLQRLNGIKNALTAIVNGVAAIVFILVAHVAWIPALILAVSGIVGAQIGAHFGRRLHPTVLRAVIATGGIAAIIRLLV